MKNKFINVWKAADCFSSCTFLREGAEEKEKEKEKVTDRNVNICLPDCTQPRRLIVLCLMKICQGANPCKVGLETDVRCYNRQTETDAHLEWETSGRHICMRAHTRTSTQYKYKQVFPG